MMGSSGNSSNMQKKKRREKEEETSLKCSNDELERLNKLEKQFQGNTSTNHTFRIFLFFLFWNSKWCWKTMPDVFEQLGYKTILPVVYRCIWVFHIAVCVHHTTKVCHQESSPDEKKTTKDHTEFSFLAGWRRQEKWQRLCCRHDAINCLLANASHCSLRPINLQKKNLKLRGLTCRYERH